MVRNRSLGNFKPQINNNNNNKKKKKKKKKEEMLGNINNSVARENLILKLY